MELVRHDKYFHVATFYHQKMSLFTIEFDTLQLTVIIALRVKNTEVCPR